MRRAFLIVTELPGPPSDDSYLADEDYNLTIVAGTVPNHPAVRRAIMRKVALLMEEGQEGVIGGRRAR